MHDLIIKDANKISDVVIAIIFSGIIWRLCYLALSYVLPKKSKEFHSRILAGIHGAITFTFGFTQCLNNDSPLCQAKCKTTPAQSLLLIFSIGYFIHDLIWCLQYDRKDRLMIAHHLYSALFMTINLVRDINGVAVNCGLGAMESTNPLLQARWFTRDAGLYPSLLFTCFEVGLFIVYITVRIILSSYHIWILLNCKDNELDFKISSLVIYIISWLFLFKMTNYVYYKYYKAKTVPTKFSATHKDHNEKMKPI